MTNSNNTVYFDYINDTPSMLNAVLNQPIIDLIYHIMVLIVLHVISYDNLFSFVNNITHLFIRLFVSLIIKGCLNLGLIEGVFGGLGFGLRFLRIGLRSCRIRRSSFCRGCFFYHLFCYLSHCCLMSKYSNFSYWKHQKISRISYFQNS